MPRRIDSNVISPPCISISPRRPDDGHIILLLMVDWMWVVIHQLFIVTSLPYLISNGDIADDMAGDIDMIFPPIVKLITVALSHQKQCYICCIISMI